MPLSRVAASSLRSQPSPNPLLKAIVIYSECSNCGRSEAQRRLFSEISPQRHAQAAVAEARKDEDAPPAVNVVVQPSRPAEPRTGIAYRSTMQGWGGAAPPERQQQRQQAGMNSYLFAQEARKKWQQNQRTHTTGQAAASGGQFQSIISPGNSHRTVHPLRESSASGVLDGMLDSIFRPASAATSAASSMFPPTANSRPKLDFAARWASEVKSMDKDLSLSPRDAYTTKVRSSLGSNAMTMALRKMKRLVHESEVRRKLFQEKYHERPGLKRKRLKMVRWRKRFAGDFKRICQRANKLAGQGW